MSNSFPKVSPDGRWIVYVQCRNGQLCARMASFILCQPRRPGAADAVQHPTHEFLAQFFTQRRWLVFSSKSRSPYTQMFLTHLDEEGNDSPAILIENRRLQTAR